MITAMAPKGSVRGNRGGGALAEFEEIYRGNVGVVAAYFARRCREPQEVADLTSETIVRAAGSFDSFDPRRGSARAWLFGIAAHVWAGHCAQAANSRDAVDRLAGRRALEDSEIEELAAKIDAQHATAASLGVSSARSTSSIAARSTGLSTAQRFNSSRPSCGVPRGVLRMRLSRARARLRKEYGIDE